MRRALPLVLACVLGCAEPTVCRSANLIDMPDVVMSVVLSDYASSAIVLVRADGSNVVWLDSGSRAPQLVSALSGDIVLPSTQLTPHALVLLDRYQSDVLTVLPFVSATSQLWQADLRGGRTSGASPNPQDAVALPDGRWLVSRFNPSLASVAELARGNDLIVLDPRTQAPVSRVDLQADVVLDNTHFYARPSRLAPLEAEGTAYVLVGLARLSDLSTRATGPGAIALVDAARLTTTLLELPGLSNCGAVAAIPGHAGEAFVLCQGDAFATDESRSGIVHVAIENGILVERARVSVARDPSLPPPGNGLVAIDEDHVVYVAQGSLNPPSPDRVVSLHLPATAAPADVAILGEAQAFTLGEGAYDPRNAQLHIPDGEMRAVRRFSWEAPQWREQEARAMPLCLHLPPRQVALLE